MVFARFVSRIFFHYFVIISHTPGGGVFTFLISMYNFFVRAIIISLFICLFLVFSFIFLFFFLLFLFSLLRLSLHLFLPSIDRQSWASRHEYRAQCICNIRNLLKRKGGASCMTDFLGNCFCHMTNTQKKKKKMKETNVNHVNSPTEQRKSSTKQKLSRHKRTHT